jgi:glycosyltransferase involved in cell wall biosynthesis
LTREIRELGHEVEVVSISRRGGGPQKYAGLVTGSVAAARRWDPDVVFAHFLFPAGAAGVAASLAARAPLVVMGHGQDVANIGEIRGVKQATAMVIGRASAVIANCGIDLEAFRPIDAGTARRELGWDGAGPAFVCVGSLIDRKNVIALADAFATLGRGRLAFVGDGPLRERLENRDRVAVVGRIPQSDVPRWVAAADVLCQPSLIEPFGQATLEGMAMERSVVATTVGGPPEFVTAEAGVLVAPGDVAGLTAALERAAGLPSPNQAARVAAAEHDVKVEAAKMVAVLERVAQR